MLSIGTIVMGAADVRRAAEFWGGALGYVPRDGEIDEAWTVLVPAAGGGPGLALGRSTTPVQEHPRVHLDLYVADAAEQEAEVARLVALGALRVAWDSYPEDPDFVVLADPEGNRFCVIDSTHG
ncbi:VOC family protein [Streptomyces sp. NPDC057011]|uniref:VOC family protein n=1 Tax=unclassified Streptomyces TaxID=2593676 RepID=UPI0036265FF0